jgi:hypothetical protein
MDTLKDIKPLVVIADNSFIYLLVLLFVVLLVVLLAGYFGWKKFQLKRRNAIITKLRAKNLRVLRNNCLDFTRVFKFSLYGK